MTPRERRRLHLRELGWNVRFLYLDAKTETLVKRFSETRRRHPFSPLSVILVDISSLVQSLRVAVALWRR